MAKTNLRGYNREIETLIDQNNINEAIAHCKYILKLFPKHLDTYRLLGKAYLESRHFSDAADLFKRVLSVYPDDFIAQIGTSIIREDEGNLDEAIMHMERAFEVQPSTTAIQDELRRLYGRRDGVSPTKVRLTRGALVRMYARGELYPQAIAEAKAALVEEPDRIDIAVLLAKMHSICNQKMEAAEICNQILSKLPYCYDANQILFEILPESSQEERKVYQQRLFAINPYSAYLSPSFPTVSLVPEQSVTLERLEYTGEMGGEDQPDWAKSVGAELNSKEEQPGDWLPDNSDQFIHSTEITSPASAPEEYHLPEPVAKKPLPQVTHPVIVPAAEDDDLIPDWMQSEGWKKTDRSADDIMSSQPEPEPDMAIPADMPSWLQEMAPDENRPSIPPIEPSTASEDLSWLQEQPVQSQNDNLVPPTWLLEEQTANTADIETAVSIPENMDESESKTPTAPPSPTLTPAIDSDLDAGIAWMEQLASKQGQNDAPAAGTTMEGAVQIHSDSIDFEALFSAQPGDSDVVPGGPVSQAGPGILSSNQESNDEKNNGETELLPGWLLGIENVPENNENFHKEPHQPSTSSWVPEIPLDLAVNENNTVPEISPVKNKQEAEAPDEIPDWLQPVAIETNANNVVPEEFFAPEMPPDTHIKPESSQPSQMSGAIPEQLPEWITSQAVIDNLSPAAAVLPTEVEPENLMPVAEASVAPQDVSGNPVLSHSSVNLDQIPASTISPEQPDPVAVSTPQAAPVLESKPIPPTAAADTSVYLLDLARQAADANHIQDALDHLNSLIQDGVSMDKVTTQLMEMAYRHPVEPSIWQTLGDAYFKSNQLQSAIDAYTKAEELIR